MEPVKWNLLKKIFKKKKEKKELQKNLFFTVKSSLYDNS